MSKVMVVEDDDNLRQIYGIRLTAEGYTVVSASNGEEALAMAVQEKPDLILSDVMMPKISGFDMLDVLRSTPETAHTKVILMTALSGDEQRDRGSQLGADRYLVKSQVGIEDVVNVVKEVLAEGGAATTASVSEPNVAPAAPTPDLNAAPSAPAAPAVAPVAPAPQPAPTAQPITQPLPAQPAAIPQPVTPAQPTPAPAPAVTPVMPSAEQPAMPAMQPSTPTQPAAQPQPMTQPVAQPQPAPQTQPAPQPAVQPQAGPTTPVPPAV